MHLSNLKAMSSRCGMVNREHFTFDRSRLSGNVPIDDARGTTQTGGMEFLARQDPEQTDFASLTPEQFEELLAIAERDNNQPLLDVIETEATRRLDQENRNQQRQGGDSEQQIPATFGDNFLQTMLNNTDEQIAEAVPWTRQQIEAELARRQRVSQPRPDVLQGDGGRRSSRGFDTQRGQQAAREGAEAANVFDDTETYPSPDNIVEKMDEIYTELDSIQPEQMGASSRNETEALTGAQANQKRRLLEQLEQAQQALRRRIPGRGTRLNMGIDPTQLGEAARGLWKNIANWMDTSETGKRLKGHLRQNASS